MVSAQEAINEERLTLDDRYFELSRLRGEASLEDELNRERAKLVQFAQGSQERVDQLLKIAKLEQQVFDQQNKLRDKHFELARARGEASLQDELNRERAKLAQLAKNNEERVSQLLKIAKLEQQIIDEESKLRKEQFEAAKKESVEAAELFVQGLESELAFTRLTILERKALEEDLTKFKAQAVELRKKHDEDEAKAFQKHFEAQSKLQEKAVAEAIANNDKEQKHRFKTRKIDLEDYLRWLAEQHAANQGNREKQRAIEKEIFDLTVKHQKEQTKILEQEERERLKAAQEAAKAREKLSKELAKKAVVIQKELHKLSIELNQEGLRTYADNLKARAAQLEKHGKTESEEYKQIQERITEADELFHKRRVELAIKEADQKLAEDENYRDEYARVLDALMRDENTNVEDRIALAVKLASFKRNEFKVLSEDEIQFLENILAKEELNANEIEKLTGALTGIIKDNAEEREEAHKTADENAEAHAKKTSEQIRETWERDTKAIVEALFSISDSLEDISPVAAGVFDFIGNLADGVAASIGKIKDGSFGAADALKVIGSAAQASSSIAISALGGVVNAIGQIASGNIIGGIASGVTTVVGLIGGLFSRSSKAAKKAREEAQKFREEMEKLQQDVRDWAKDLGESLSGTFAGIDVGDFIRITLGADIDDGNGFLNDFARGLVENILKARAKVADALANISDNFDVSDIFSIETGEITDEGLKIVGEISDFAGRYVTTIEDIQQKILEGTNRISAETRAALDRQLGEAIADFDRWISEFERASGFLGNSISSNLFDALTDPEISMEDAAGVLDASFKEFVLKTILDMATQAVLASGVVAAKMADLTVLIEEAIRTGNWDAVTAAVSETSKLINDTLLAAGESIKEGVAGLIPDEAAETLKREAEAFKQKVADATNTLGGFLSTGLSNLFVEKMSLEDAGKALDRQLKDHIINMIIQAGVDTVLATAGVANSLALLGGVIADAIKSGDWTSVSVFVTNMSSDLMGLLENAGDAIEEGVKGLVPDKAAEEAAQKTKAELEEFEAKVSDATNTISGLLSDSFYNAITDPSTSFKDATKVLDRQFKEHVIKTIIDLGVQSVLASATVAEDLVKLSDVITEAIASGDWSQVTSTVNGIGHNLLSKFSELSISIRDGVQDLLPEEDVDNFAKVFNQRLEDFKAKIQQATSTLSGFLSSNLSEAIFNPEVSLSSAGDKLAEDFDKFVIQTILDMATKAALATGAIASQIVGLSEFIEEAFSTGNWEPVKAAVASVSKDLTQAFNDIAENVGGALNEVFNKRYYCTNKSVCRCAD